MLLNLSSAGGNPEVFSVVELSIGVVVTFVASVLIGLFFGACVTCLIMNNWVARSEVEILNKQEGKEAAEHNSPRSKGWNVQTNSAYGNKEWDVQNNSAYGNKKGNLQANSAYANKEWSIQTNSAYDKNQANSYGNQEWDVTAYCN